MLGTAPETRDYFAEMYVAGVLADAGWDIYFPRRDRGFDMIASRTDASGETLVRPVQVKGKYATESKTPKKVYGFVGKITAFHDDMVLAMPFFTLADIHAPALIAWMTRDLILPHAKGWRCEPAIFDGNKPKPRPSLAHCFGIEGLARLALPGRAPIQR